MKICSNCKAEIPEDNGGAGLHGEFICCAHCLFNPLGCRCQYGELGVPETYVDPEPLDPYVAREFGIFNVFDEDQE